MDEELRTLERLAREGGVGDVIRLRAARRRAGIGKVYSVVEGRTYADALHILRASFVGDDVLVQPTIEVEGKRLVRPLTLKESLVERIVDFNVLTKEDGSVRTFDERSVLWRTYLDSCTGIIYEKETSNFKISPVSFDLLKLKQDFNERFIRDIDYNSVVGVPLDSSKGIYGDSLTDKQFLEHLAWRAVFDDDKVLMKEYREVWKEVFKQFIGHVPYKGMCFYVCLNTADTELRTLFVDNCEGSFASGGGSLDFNSCFVRVAQT